jgi:tetratricopeptide (TPR) repeat protein
MTSRLQLLSLVPGALLGVAAGCAAPPDPAAPQNHGRPPAAVRQVLAPGTVVRLPAVALAMAPDRENRIPLAFVHALLRESLRQSARLDLASGIEDDPGADHSILVTLNPTAGHLTTTLARKGAPPIPLATATFSPEKPLPSLLHAVDELALNTRRALGEQVRATPVQATLAYSASLQCVSLTEEARDQLARGKLRGAMARLRKARSEDGGCAFTLMLLATVANALGEPREAVRIADEALRLNHRLTPTTSHRLLRTYRLAMRDDRRLLVAGQVFGRERPYDPHGVYTEALALNLLGDSAAALPKLQTLARRWPENASVQFQLGYACLGTGRWEAALAAFEAARQRLPEPLTVRPLAMALFHAGKQEQLAGMLQRLAASPRVKAGPAFHEVLRMQAAQSILVKDLEAAAAFLLADLSWVRSHATDFDRYALEVAEAGEILARLGKNMELSVAIQGFLELPRLPPTFRAALTYMGGLVTVAENQKPEAAQAVLTKGGRETWSQKLAAANHRRRGELREEARALERAMGGTSDPLVLASYARVLLAAGEREKSERIAKELHKRLVSFDQRRPRQHPLMSPARAMAYVATAPE